jgi:hypothetical protein
MYVDPKSLIAGVRPAVLKRLFQRDDFSIHMFMTATKLQRTEASAKLAELHSLGWIDPDPKSNGVWWIPTNRGAQLGAASLLPPISVQKARGVVRQVVEAADAVNADPTFFYAVERLALFGSLVAATIDGTVGDVDIAYGLVPREGAVPSVDDPYRPHGYTKPAYFWPGERVLRRLKARQVSFHRVEELEALKIASTTIYNRGVITLPW